jgi:hypothetical protein
MRAGASPGPRAAADETSKVRTFGMPDVDESGDDFNNDAYGREDSSNNDEYENGE